MARFGKSAESFYGSSWGAILLAMELDPHTLQQILRRIYQQMRCPQCGKKVPVDFSSVRVMAENVMLLQLKCESCDAYIVLQASLQGIDKISAPPYEDEETANASSTLELSDEDLDEVREKLELSNGSFKTIFGEVNADTEPEEEEGDDDEEDSDDDNDNRAESSDGPALA